MSDERAGPRVALEMISAGTGFGPAAGGMTTYYEGLSAHLPDSPGIGRVGALMPPGTSHAAIRPGPKLDVVECGPQTESRAIRVGFEHLGLPRAARRWGADVLVSTHNVRPLAWRGPSVVVLQSIQHFLLSSDIGRARLAYLRAAVPRSLRSADRVISVSEATRGDAIDLFDLDPDRIVTVHHGCSPWATEAAARFANEGTPPPPPGVEDGAPYLATVSSLYELKNHRRLIEAFALARRETGAPHVLVIAGREADVTIAELRAVAERSGVADSVRLLGAYPQEHLPALLANAAAIVYPSLYETFGHPVLEAFAFGRPLVTSSVSGCSEVAAEAAVKVDPLDTESIAEGIARIVSDEDLRTRLSELGARRLADFSWSKCAAGTAAAITGALAEHGNR